MACLVQNTTAVEPSTATGNWSPLYGGTKLDQDTIKYIHKFYCKDCRMEAEKAKAAKAGTDGAPKPTSPQQSLDEASLHQTMDKNKETLKRKLMLRRTVNELVDQGIYPPLKTPPAFAEQRKQLERAKTGDLLRHKIQSRPDRQALVQQHILEDSKADPSLQDKQRALKRARLLDGLNDKIFHRPGPLELVKGNILQADNKFQEAVKDGTIRFSSTFDMEDSSDQIGEDDSNQSDGAPSPSQTEDSYMSDLSSPNSIIPTIPDISILLQNQQKNATHGSPLPLNKIPPITTQSFLGPVTGSIFANSNIQSSSKSCSGGNGSKSSSSSGSRHKKHKPKIQAKSKVIKFHEYKGPPNVVKTQPAAPSPPDTSSETPYHVMLQQQQLFLQWQLEFQQKNMPFNMSNPPLGPDGTPITLPPGMVGSVPSASEASPQACSVSSPPPAPPLPGTSQSVLKFHQKSPSPQPVTPPPPPPPPPPPASKHKQQNSSSNTGTQKSFSTFDEMKVADLKVELKKRNLPVSGPKPQLIERLRPFADSILTPAQNTDVNTPVSNPILSPIANLNTVIKMESNLKMEPLIKIEPGIKLEPGTLMEENMNMCSPPISPTDTEASLTPMSPDGMDIQSPSSLNKNLLKSQFSSSQGSIPMIVDQISRPPSAAPMEIAPMETDQTSSIINSVADFTQSLQPGFKGFTAVAQPMPLTSPLLNNQQLSPQLKQEQPRFTQDEMLRQQQKKIEELQRQLQQSQLQLKIHQEQQRLLQQQKILQQQVQQHQQQLAKHQTLQKLQLQKQQQQQLQQQQQQSPKSVQHVSSPPLVQSHPRTQTPTSTTHNQSPQSPPQAVSTIQISIVDGSKVPQIHRGVSGSQQIQIPVHLLQASQALQNSTNALPPVIMSNAVTSPTRQTKVSVSQSQQVVVPDLNLGKPHVSFASPPPNGQPFIFSSTTDTSTKTSEVMPPNGITRATSLPGSPLDGQSISRSSSTPFFAIPLKEPPKYDEAIKSKNQIQTPPLLLLENQLPGSPSTHLATKSQAIDDVLEILIRNGELPPSAAQEPPPTPKTTSSAGSITSETPTVSLSMDAMLSSSSPSYGSFSPQSVMFGDPSTSTMTTLHTPVSSPLSTGHREMSPHPFILSPPPHCQENPTHELSLSEQDGLPAHLDLDFANMDWSSDPALGLDLADSAGLSIDPSRFVVDGGKMLSVPYPNDPMSPQRGGSSHGSEPDLAALGLHDPDVNGYSQMDVSHWLDVIMPSTGLTPLSTNAPVSFPSDPVLTPKTQQEVLDLFNFDEADLNSDAHVGINWDTITEPSTS